MDSHRASLPVLFIAALVPRIMLAHQLDLVTDEIIYIMGGKGYFPLLLHLRFRSNLWLFNYEHPPVVKLLIGLSIFLNAHLGRMLSELFAARVPSILSGTILIVAIWSPGCPTCSTLSRAQSLAGVFQCAGLS